MDYTSSPASYAYVALFTILGILFMVATMIASWAFRPHRPTREKLSTYECGAPVTGDAWIQFRVGFYLWGLIFLIFDVEAVFVYPWAKMLRQLAQSGLGMFAFLEMFIFFMILVVGLIYAWRKGVLKWEGV
ncbi:MAG: NADH-quinone oxidoreductase subunit A [Abditibacteriales bacterium]|nr:NADH-quinone oxidoreductase subunit A [Abditibacteriales bacterium]MDW8367487.1 NADH-quinone oxidoreductase subunit A [Abditibacteriales bacterium]